MQDEMGVTGKRIVIVLHIDVIWQFYEVSTKQKDFK